MKKNYSHVSFSLVVILFFTLTVPVVFGAAVCVTNPQDGLCPLNIAVTPSSYTVPLSGNTNVSLDISGILQYEVKVVAFDVWMVEEGTGNVTYLTPNGSWPTYGGIRNVNTGALTKSVTLHACVENFQGTIACDSSYISIPSPTVNIYFN